MSVSHQEFEVDDDVDKISRIVNINMQRIKLKA